MATSDNYVPKTLKECYATDSVSNDLWIWSNRLQLWGERVLIILLVAGVILTIATFVLVNFMSAIRVLFTWIFYAFIEYWTYRILSLLIASLATIVQNTKITANVAIYSAAKEEGSLNEVASETTASTKSGTGYSLSDMAKKRNDQNSWICKECGTANESSNRYCKDCGKYR